MTFAKLSFSKKEEIKFPLTSKRLERAHSGNKSLLNPKLCLANPDGLVVGFVLYRGITLFHCVAAELKHGFGPLVV